MAETIATPTSIADIIAWIESRHDCHAFRFEPATYSKTAATNAVSQRIITKIKTIHNCSFESARVIYSSSFGKYQIMGFNLYGDAINIAVDFMEYGNDESLQDKTFYEFLQINSLSTYTVDSLANAESVRELFGARYNGNAKAYAQQIIASLQHYNIKVI